MSNAETATAAKTPNYTPEMVSTITAMYNELHPEQGNACLETIGEAVNRSVKSIRAKLVLEKVYVPTPKVITASKDDGPSKKELLNDLSDAGFNTNGLSGATKDAITRILSLVQSQDA
jgi:hypothetical protein